MITDDEIRSALRRAEEHRDSHLLGFVIVGFCSAGVSSVVTILLLAALPQF